MDTKFRITALSTVMIMIFATLPAPGQDWPMWRFDHARTGAAEISLPGSPGLLWTRQMEEPGRCWPFQYEDYYTGGNPDQIGKLSFDISFEPVIGQGKLFVPSMVSDRITAYSADGGQELWRFYAGGPVRFAPVYNNGKVYFISDDGYLYCLSAADGNMLWKYHGSYSDRMVLGNERIISMWPARGGPVFMDGTIYFAAGVMPFEGIFIHAVDAETGREIWTNSTTGTIWNLHQHGGAYSYGGPSPQGYLAISGEKLIVPGGRTPPAVFDRNTGEFLYFNQASGMVGKGAGGYRIFAAQEWFLNHGMLYALDDGAQFGHVPGDVITDQAFIGINDNRFIAHKSSLNTIEVEIEDRLQRGAIAKRYELQELWNEDANGAERIYLKTASHFVVSKNNGRTLAMVAAESDGKPGQVKWEQTVDGEIWSVLAGNGNLYAVTTEGKIYCFGEDRGAGPKHFAYEPQGYTPDREAASLAGSIAGKANMTGGYAMIYGGKDIDLIKAIAAKTELHLLVVERESHKVEQLRNMLDNAGIYGKKVSVINRDPETFTPLPYIYDLVVMDGADYTGEMMQRVYNSLRPYGGIACITGAGEQLAGEISSLNMVNGKPAYSGGLVTLTREGPLPGAAQWTHQYASAANRTYSDEELVKPPLGTLWFGGPSNLNALPRHHNGPIPQVAGGRLFILGVETISARCVYTGRELWVKEIPGIGHPFTDLEFEERFKSGTEVYMPNHPGANFIGSPYVSLEDAVYVTDKDRMLKLDPSTGETILEFRLPAMPGTEINEFGHLLVWGDYLITTIDPQIFDDGEPGKEKNWNATSSNVLLVMDRNNGNVLWSKRAKKGFRHNAIVAGSDKVFAVDGLSEGVLEILHRRGLDTGTDSEIFALDLRTGNELWSLNENVFGTWLGLYEGKNILLQGGRHGQRRPLDDEPNERLTAHNSLTGEIIWENSTRYSGPLGLHEDMIISARPGEPAFSPYTGEFILREHPLTGEDYEWNWHKYYGCGTMNSSRYLIMFRSGTAGYTDLFNFGGTGNLGGFRAGCTNNMVAADGILNAPDYTRTCTCSYPLQTSVGLIHMPGAGIEMWTVNRLGTGNRAISSLGINFGGQGNRGEDGVLWLEYPKVYAAGPDLPVTIRSNSHEWFRNHATWILNNEEKHNWVASYGLKGAESVSVELVPEGEDGAKYYTVTLYFAEPEEISGGKRVFDVSLQGEKVIENLDIVREAGGTRRTLRKEFSGIKVDRDLVIEFSNGTDKPVISGIEVVMEGNVADVTSK